MAYDNKWSLKEEEFYIEDTVRMHNKRRVGCNHNVDGIAIFKTWLKTYKQRRSYLSGIDCLASKVTQYLAQLEDMKK